MSSWAKDGRMAYTMQLAIKDNEIIFICSSLNNLFKKHIFKKKNPIGWL